MSTSRFSLMLLVLTACGNQVEGVPSSGVRNTPLAPSSVSTPSAIGSWAAEYYASTNLAGPPLRRTEGGLDFDWGRGSPDPSIPEDGFSARWTGNLEVGSAATYSFATTSDDGLRVVVDGRTLIDFWNDHGASDYDATLPLAAGTHHVTVEFYENWGEAVARVEVTREGGCDMNMPPTEEPNPPPAGEPTPGAATAYNILVRGQSNALLFVEWGGVWAMRSGVAARLGVAEDAINIIADRAHPQGHNTINSGTGFIADWMDGAQPRDLENGLLAAIADMSPEAKQNPTLVLWMHNEYDQQHSGLDTETWLISARADGRMVREALGQPPSRTPYLYVWVPYGYASPGSPEAVWNGMNTLVEDASFNASWGTSIQQSDMGDPSHMSDQGSDAIGARIAPEVAEILSHL